MPDKIITALDTHILLAEPVFREVYYDPGKRITPQKWLKRLEKQGLIEIVQLSGAALIHYLDLVADRLDDGESATIAVAINNGATPVIDEKCARRLYQSHYPDKPLSSTAELFRQIDGHEHMPADTLRSALLQTLQIAKMRVTPEMADWVMQTIGEENAAQCSSLNKYRR